MLGRSTLPLSPLNSPLNSQLLTDFLDTVWDFLRPPMLCFNYHDP